MGKNPRNAVPALVILVAVLGFASWRLSAPLLEPLLEPLLKPQTHAERCDLSSQDCSISVGSQELYVEVLPRRPTPGEELRLILRPTSGIPLELGSQDITVDFSMPAMDMGEHVLKPVLTELGTLEGRITLPSCPMGRPIWRVAIWVDQTQIADFVLRVGGPDGRR